MKTILCISPYWKEEHRWMICTLRLSELWLEMGYRVVVVCMHTQRGLIIQKGNLFVYGVKDLFLPDPFNFGIAPDFYFHVFRLIKKYTPEKIIVMNLLFWTSWSAILLRILGYSPLVVTDAIVGMTWWPRKWYMRIIMGIGGWTMGLLTMKFAKKIVFFHPQPVTLLRSLGVYKKSFIIPSGIVSNNYLFHIPSHVNKESIVISYVGRLESVKGVDDFCAAVVEVKKKYGNIVVRVVGKYDQNSAVYKEYSEIVDFMGFTTNVESILSNSDIFVLPSYSEGLSNALMEAMCSGCACIATNVGGNTFLLNNGECGLLFTPGDRKKLIEHITRCINNTGQRIALAKAARARIENFFDWSIVQKEYSQLFSEIL